MEDLELGLLQSDLVMSPLGHSRELTNRHAKVNTERDLLGVKCEDKDAQYIAQYD